MPKLRQLTVEGFRSIADQVVINFPENQPVVLIGENNSGKSNIIRAIELMFGEFHPKYKKLEDYDHYKRDPNCQIIIETQVSGFTGRLGRSSEFSCGGFNFKAKKGSDNDFVAVQAEDGNENIYVSSALREELLCVVVNSEQNLNYQLSYSSKFTLLSKVTKAFHDKLNEDADRVNKLKELFENIKLTFLEVEEFNTFSTNMSSIAEQMLLNMTHGLAFDFSAYDPSNYFKTLRVHPTENGETRAFEESGTGQQQILALSFAHAYAKSFLGHGLLFIIDEPEAHLLDLYFDLSRVVYSDGNVKSKPHPDIFLKAMSKLNLKANEVLIFEDSIAGIKAAENSKAQELIIVNSNNDDYTQWNYQEIVDFSEVDKSLFTCHENKD